MNGEIYRGEVDYSRVVEKEKITTLPRLLSILEDEFDKEEFYPAAITVKKIGQILGMKDGDVVAKTYRYLRNNDVLDFQRSELPNGIPEIMILGNQIHAFGAILLTVRDSLAEAKNGTSPKIDWRKTLPATQKSLIACGKPELAKLIVYEFHEPMKKQSSYKGPEAAEEIPDELAIAEFDILTDIAPLCTTGVIKNALGHITRDNDSVESNSQEIPAEIAMLVTTIFQSFKERKIMKLRSEDATNLTVGQFKHMLKWCLLTMEQNGLGNLLQLHKAIDNHIRKNGMSRGV